MNKKTDLTWICDLLHRETLVLEIWRTQTGYACLASRGSERPAKTAYNGEGKTLVAAIRSAWGVLMVEEKEAADGGAK